MIIKISGTGSYIPEQKITNAEFHTHIFYEPGGKILTGSPEMIIKKFEEITGIHERRYVRPEQQMSDIAFIAAQRAIQDSGTDAEQLDGIILAHTCGNVAFGNPQADILPSIASRVKYELGIKNPECIAFDILFGCPGWLQGVILARQHILSEGKGRFLVIGAETLSRVIDPHDRDSMIYSDGAAAAVIESVEEKAGSGIISTAALTYSYEEANYLFFDTSNKTGFSPDTRYLKMQGRKIYEFVLKYVPQAMKHCFDKSGFELDRLKKIILHQANEKMDIAITRGFYKLYGKETPEGVMPMNIHHLGNSSVATIPTLLDMVLKNQIEQHTLVKGDVILMASVGAGMNVNAITYVV